RLPAYEGEVGEHQGRLIVVQLPEAFEDEEDLQEVSAAVLETPDARTPLSLDFVPGLHEQLH
ncbi:MAG: hypothetical protein ACPHRO_09360, partial [Nannocystaceae bacterium]